MNIHALDSFDKFKQVFIEPFDYKISSIIPAGDKKSQVYHAASFKLNNCLCLFRSAKTTANRPGQFVTLWKRSNGKIEPYDFHDKVRFVIIATRCPIGRKEGFFIFPRTTLLKENIFSNSEENKKGKLAFRVFPPWSENFISNEENKTNKMSDSGRKSQKWQLEHYFLATKGLTKDAFEFI